MKAILARHMLIVINLGFLVFATILIVFGGMTLSNIYNWEGVVSKTVPTWIVVLGGLVFIFAFIGFFGAILENNSLILIYSICSLTLLTLEILLLFYTYYDKDKLAQISEDGLEKSWKLKQEGDASLVNILQNGLKCCGVKGDSDYGEPTNIPNSCYIQLKRGRKTLAKQGCKSALTSFILNDLTGCQYILLAIVAFKAIMFALGCFLSGYGGQEELEFLEYFRRPSHKISDLTYI